MLIRIIVKYSSSQTCDSPFPIPHGSVVINRIRILAAVGELFLSHPIVSLMLKVSNSAVTDEINVDWFLILIDTIYYET